MKYKFVIFLAFVCLVCIAAGCTGKSDTQAIPNSIDEKCSEALPVSGNSLNAVGYDFSLPEKIGISDPNPVELQKPNITAQTFRNDTWRKVDIPGEYTFICLNVSYWGNASDEVELMYLQAFYNDEIQSDQTIFSINHQSFQKAEVSPYIVFQDRNVTIYDWLSLVYPNGFSDVVDNYQKELKGTEGETFNCDWFAEVRTYLLSNLSSILTVPTLQKSLVKNSFSSSIGSSIISSVPILDQDASENTNVDSSSSHELEIEPTIQAFDTAMLTENISSAMLFPGYGKGRFHIIEETREMKAAERLELFFAALPMQDLMILDDPGTFECDTAVQILGGNRFDYWWYVQPDYTYYKNDLQGIYLYTSSTQELYDILSQMPVNNPELFDAS